MAQDNRTVDQKYDEQSGQQQDKLKQTHEGNTTMYGNMRTVADSAYEAMKTEAHINKALSELAGGPASASMTHRQRGESALRNELGGTDRQHGRFAANVDLALKNLDTQFVADQAYTEAMNNALRNAEKTNRSQFDAELGLKKNYYELEKSNSVFDQMYKLYTNRLVDKDTFKAMTGYDVKDMPKPRKVVRKTTTVIKLGNKPAKVGAGYELHHEYDPKTNTVTYYAVKKETAVQHRDKDISLFENGRMKSDQQLYADLHYDGYATADAAGKQKILEANKRDFERQFGEGYYNLYNNFYTNMGASGQYFTDDQKARLQTLIANSEDYASQHSGGWDSFSLAYSTAWNNANVHMNAKAIEQAKMASQTTDQTSKQPEEDYVARRQKIEASELENYDFEKGQAEIDDLQNQLNAQKNIISKINAIDRAPYDPSQNATSDAYVGDDYIGRLENHKDPYANMSDAQRDAAMADAQQQKAYLENLIGQKQQQYTDAEYAKKYQGIMNGYKDVFESPDFEEYAAKGAAIENDTEGWGLELFGWTPFQSINNKVMFGRKNYFELVFGAANSSESAHTKYAKYYFMTGDEVRLYNYLLAKDKENATEKAESFLNQIDFVLNARQMGESIEGWKRVAEQHPVAASVLSVPMSMLSGAGYIKAGATHLFGGEIDPNDPVFGASRGVSAIRGQVSSDIHDSVGGGFGGKLASFGYQTGMSMADWAASAAVTGGFGSATGIAAKVGEAGMLTIMGTNAATAATLDAFDRGATQDQAMAAGFWAGAAEVVFEKISLDHFIKIKSPQARVTYITNALKQAGIEGSEEGFTQIANIISDYLIMGDKSNYSQAIKNHMADGMSESGAKAAVLLDMAKDVGLNVLGGAFSGGVIGSMGSVMNSVQTSKVGNSILSGGAGEALVNNALTLPKNTEAFKLASQIRDGAVAVDAKNIGRLAVAYEEAGGNTSFMQMQNVETQNGEVLVPELPVVGTGNNDYRRMTPEQIGQQIGQRVHSNIKNHAQTNPNVVHNALIRGMTVLDSIETRIKGESRNVNHPGIGLGTIHDMFMDYVANKVKMKAITLPMTGSIKAVMATQMLTAAETEKLMNTLTDIIGDTRLAETYFRIGKMLTSLDEKGGIEYNVRQILVGHDVKTRKVDGRRTSKYRVLNEEEISSIIKIIKILGADPSIFRFNQGNQTGFLDSKGIINVRGDVLPDLNSTHPRDLMSPMAVIAHEYYGHKYYWDKFGVRNPEPGAWNDEFRASYHAAIYAPNMSNMDRMYLMMDALERAKEGGVSIRITEIMRRILYGY
jgi:hypothetical protein